MLTLSCDQSQIPMCMYITTQAIPGDKVVSSFGRLTDTGNQGPTAAATFMAFVLGLLDWTSRSFEVSIFPLLLGEATLTVTPSTHQVPLENLLDCSLCQMCYCHISSRMDLLTTYLPTHTHTPCSNLASSQSPQEQS